MGLGILNPRKAVGQIPGTVLLLQDEDKNQVLLTPRPSKSVNDPLVSLCPRRSTLALLTLRQRWPNWKKNLQLLSISLGTGLCGIQGKLNLWRTLAICELSKVGTCLSVATIPITEELGISIFETESLSSYQYIAIGGSCAVSAISARVIGKRPVYLVSAALILAAAIWNAAARSYASMMGSRVLYGLGAGAFESLILSSIGDMYYVSQMMRKAKAIILLRRNTDPRERPQRSLL